ncbi:MAG: hypothetical protein UT56_C0001G0025 [Candidatus Levybacteria bacterium GW2011_GWB1_39_7]|nr:MAG: hypothetical protein UT20_C0001G0003 [Candidatus Levybacteria bacterium GW2011_GWA1_39_11]KKR25294.1 MAG: hypothetical protein UT56_C0001G0025 [Candidatus Levybacteria bacterium GW2011_GWB1_39_7]OGH48381.1 MAG: hypothetical protein A3G66_02540 [Candidatus Levybacteria bacterium RIFCSPLOWO2_12_FULL_39_17]
MKKLNNFVTGIAVTLIVLGIIGSAYYFGKSQVQKGSDQVPIPSPTTTQEQVNSTPAPTQEQTGDFVNPSATIENIKASVESKNYAALEGYMTDKVSVILYATECCGLILRQEAISQMAYLNNGKAPWDFSYPNPIQTKLEIADPANFKGNVIGTASNGTTVSFHLNDKFLIDRVFMVIDYKLIAP